MKTAPASHRWFSTSSGHIELHLRTIDAAHASHSGDNGPAVKELRRMPYIRSQLDEIDSTLLCRELKEYGAWDETELANHEENLDRILWLACHHIAEGEHY